MAWNISPKWAVIESFPMQGFSRTLDDIQTPRRVEVAGVFDTKELAEKWAVDHIHTFDDQGRLNHPRRFRVTMTTYYKEWKAGDVQE